MVGGKMEDGKMENILQKNANPQIEILRGYLSIGLLIMDYIYNKQSPTTIEELKMQLKMPRSTIVEHLKMLERDGLIERDKEGRILQYLPVKEISDRMKEAFLELKGAYLFALTHIQEKRLKKLKSTKGV